MGQCEKEKCKTLFPYVQDEKGLDVGNISNVAINKRSAYEIIYQLRA